MTGDLLSAARAEGRTELIETEAMGLARTLGVAFPGHVVASGPDEVAQMIAELSGDRVVVKALAPGLIHKTEAGLVRVTKREHAAATAAAMGDGAGGLRGFLIAEFVPHAVGPPAELLIGMRRTHDFGPVVTLAPGGVFAELLIGTPPIVLLETDDPAAIVADSALGRLLTSRFRNTPAPVDALVPFLDRFRSGVADLPEDVLELECNPVVFVEGTAIALDAAARLGTPPTVAPSRPLEGMGHLLTPSSIGVVGVSKTVNPGRIILGNLLRAGYPPDRVTVVKPGSDEIDGCRCVPDLTALDRVDLLVLSVAAGQAPSLLEQVVADRVAESVILVPGGVGEREGSEDLAESITDTIGASRRTEWGGPLVIGSNSMGIISVPGSYDTLFIPPERLGFEGRSVHPVAVVSQSGAFAIARLAGLPWLRPRFVVTLGNQIDLTVGDFAVHFAGDREVDVVACYLEGFRPGDGRRFLEGAAAVRARGGSVILYQGGRSADGARSAAFHTAAVAGDHAITEALAARAGVLIADSLSDFEDLVMLTALLRDRRVDGNGLGAVSNAGFECVAIADRASGFRLARFGAATTAALTETLAAAGVDGIVGVRNPLDLTPMMGDARFESAVRMVLGDPGVDVGVVGCVPMTPALATLEIDEPGSFVARMIGLWRETDLAWVIVVDGGRLYDPMAGRLLEEGIPVFRRADRALRLMAAYCAHRIGSSP